MKNKTAFKLTLYFTIILCLFSLIIGGVFYELFKNHTIEVKRSEMKARANRIAAVIGANVEWLEFRYGDELSKSRFINDLDLAAPEIVWIVDMKRNVNMNKEEMLKAWRRSNRSFELPANGREAYMKLPDKVKAGVEGAFQGQGFILQEYNHMLRAVMLTVGVPVRDSQNNIKAVVLLHSPVEGLRSAVNNGLRILGMSIVAALISAFLISIIMSYRFTRTMNKLKAIAERLGEKDYSARSNIVQDDEIGELARTMDVLAERLQLADEESKSLEKMRRSFIANISHELRTPVTVIRGSLEALKDGIITEPEDVKEFYEQMYGESIFLQRLINDLLELSRLQNADFAIEKEKLNFCDVIKDATRSAKQLGQEKKLEITAELDREAYLVNGDYGRLKQMLMVFLHNSIKFSPEGVGIELKLQGNRLSIVDHGCGMKAEDIPHAFERFYKAHNEQNKTGSGLGLAIAKQIALRHEMDLELQSEEKVGTTITVILPVVLEG